MNGTLNTQNLLDNDNIRFMESSLDLLKDLNIFLDNISLIFNDEKRLKDLAYDYKLVFFIKNQLEQNKGNVKLMIKVLNQYMRFIERYDKKLAILISEYSPPEQKEKELLSDFSAILNEPSKVYANINILLDNAKRLENKELRLKITKMLHLIRMYYDEIRILNYDLLDINNWNLHAHDNMSFFTERVNIYFAGGETRDEIEFSSLDKFKEEELKKQVFESKEIKTIYYLAQYYYISNLISLLGQDIRGGMWIRNVKTKEFLDKIEVYANDFRQKFLNNSFAGLLIENKTRIREQPFAWISLLKKMRDKIAENITVTNQNTAIYMAKDYLSNVFKGKMELLKSKIIVLSQQLRQMIIVENGDDVIIKKIGEGVRRIENAINKVWRGRKKRFKKIRIRIENLNISTLPEIDKLIDIFNIIPEADRISKNLKGFVEYSDHKDKIMASANPLNPKSFGLFGMLAFDFKRMEEFIDNVDALEEQIKRKDEITKNYNLSSSPVKKSIGELLEIHLNLIDWIKSIMAIENLAYTIQKIETFRGDYYG